MKKKLLISTLYLMLGIFTLSCSPEDVIGENISDTTNDDDDDSVTQTENASDYVWDATNANTITLNGTSISTTSSNVSISGTTATITAAGNYIISGSLTNGQIVVEASNDALVKIQLNGISISNTSSAPFYVKKAAKTILFLASGTISTLTDATSYSSTEEPNACLFSNAYLAITGDGTLNVNGRYTDGISSDDNVIINNGVINVIAVDDGIRGKDYVKINNGTISAKATTGHALKSDNEEDSNFGYVQIDNGTITLASTSGKGVKAIHQFTQNQGTITVTESYEGIESYLINLAGGTLNITAQNDGINATAGTVSGGTESNDGSAVNITGGTLVVAASNGDALDSNGNITMTAGLAIVNGPSSGIEEAVDFNGTFNMNGGVFIGAGAKNNMNKAMSNSSSQVNMFARTNSAVSSNTLLTVRIGGTDIITFKPKYGASAFLISAPQMTTGASYEILTGGSYSTTTNTAGYYTGGTYTAGTSKITGTLSTTNTVNSINF